MANFTTKELTASVRIDGIPMKVKWVADGGNGKPELYIYGECTFDDAQRILNKLPEMVETSEKKP